LTASTANIRVDAEHLPQMTNRAENRHSADVKDSEGVELKDGSERVKELVLEVVIDILLILFLQPNDDLHWDNSFLLALDLVR